ncbi:groucho-related [Schistosoma mansoni]|uniref:groucho-related n=1 Tax=Schistosoma mansoni TaxID=6183 RepID=UPI00022DC0DB|nr:groucho-related [Schistosoma mansoni]|eukprot:XP_018651260.1 groucho-related [Schistosoma mansoni]
MFPSRPPGPSGPGGSCKFTVLETCDRIKEEFTCIQQQNHSLQLEREKLLSERSDMQRICVMYYEMANGLNLEMHRQMEIAKRLSAILTQVLPFLSQEHQSQVLSAIERAKQVTMQELNSVLAAQIEDVKSSKFFNGNNMGLPLEQFEAYKQLSVIGGANPGVSGLHASNLTSNHSGGSTSSSTPGSLQSGSANAQTSSLLPSLSPSGNPSVSAALLNGLMSAAGAASVGPGALMLQSSGSRISPLGREAEKLMSNEDKQRAAAAAAAAAGSFLLSNRSSGNGPCLVPPPPNPITGLLGGCGEFPGFPGTFPISAGLGGGDIGRSPSSLPSISQQPCRGSSTDDAGGPGGRSSNSGGIQLGSNFSGLPHSSLSALANPLLLPPPMTPTPGGNLGLSSSTPTSGSVMDEKRRKLNEPKEGGHENGNWRMNDDMRSVPERGSSLGGTGRRSGSNRQPLNLSPQLSSGHNTTYPNYFKCTCSRHCQLEFWASVSGVRGPSFNPCSVWSRCLFIHRSNHTTSIPAHFAYTGARGSVKLWDLASISANSGNTPLANRDITPLATFDCLCYDSYVRSIKLFPDVSGLIVGGESNALTVWDLNGPGRRKAELTFEAPACYALALSLDGKLAYSCCSDGQVAVWDIHNQSIVHQFHGHVDGTSCVEITGDGNRLWTGGLDHKVRCWDIRGNPSRDVYHIEFKSQVFSLGLSSHMVPTRRQAESVSPVSVDGESTSSGGAGAGGGTRDTASPQSFVSGSNKSLSIESWLAVGLESSEVEVLAIGPDGPPASAFPVNYNVPREESGSGSGNPSPISHHTGSNQPQHFRLTHHESCVLALRFAHHADWFLTTGKDHQVNAWRTPYGACLLETKEAASVLTCDISLDDKFVVTGSGDKRANLYEVIFTPQR